jgi:hypothetical protein
LLSKHPNNKLKMCCWLIQIVEAYFIFNITNHLDHNNFFTYFSLTMKKKGVLQLGLQLNFWVTMTICNSLYFYTHESYQTSYMSCKRCNSSYMWSHFNATHCNIVAILSQQLLFSYYAIPLWLQP